MLEILEEYLFSVFLTTLFVWLPLHIIFYIPIHKYYELEKMSEKIDKGKERKKLENITTVISILFLSAVLLFVYKIK